MTPVDNLNGSFPMVTVYVTNRNYGKYVDECLESVYNQSFQDFELIIVDDGSTDNPNSYLEKYRHSKNTSVIFNRQQGLNASSNQALRLAKGKYIVRVDADDKIHRDMLKLLVDKMESDDRISLVFPDYFLIDEAGCVFAEERRHNFDHVSLYDQPAHGACTLIRTDTLIEINGYSEDFSCQDGFELWIRVIEHGKVANIGVPLFFYRQHEASLSKNKKKLLETRAEIIRRFSSNIVPSNSKHVAVIPVRNGSSSLFALESLGSQCVIDRQIELLLSSELITDIVLSTNSDSLIEHVSSMSYSKLIILDRRPDYLSSHHSPLELTARYICNQYFGSLETISLLTIEHLFRRSIYIDKGIRLLYLFGADSCIAVERMTDNLYKHEGAGLIPVNASIPLRCEREFIYRGVGGLHISKARHILNEGSFIGGITTHINMDELSCMDFSSPEMLQCARIMLA